MKHFISGSAAFAVLDLELDEGESVTAQPKSMVCMTTGVVVSAKLGGVTGSASLGGSIKGVLAGEGVALAIFTAKKDKQTLSLAPEAMGPIIPVVLKAGEDLLIAKGSYLACESTVTLKTEFTGLKGFLAKKGIFLVRASGPGIVFLSAFGDIREKSLVEEEKFVVDNDFVVAFEPSVSYLLVTASKGITNSFLSGEGLVNRYTGPGKLYYQTRAKSKAGLMSTLFNSVT